MADDYSVIFRGDIVLGKNLVEVKQKLAQLFKVDDARIERMFTGKPVPLKANIALTQAKKYQSVLTQAGIVTEIVDASSVSTKKVPPKTSPKPSASVDGHSIKTPENKTTASADFSLAPVGSDLVEGKPDEESKPVLVDHLSLAEQQGNIIKDDERLAPLPATVDTENLDWDLTEVGEDLLKPSEHKEVEAIDLNIDNISLSDAGGELLTNDEKKVVKDADIDTSHIKLSPGNTITG